LFAYELLRHFGKTLPPFRSSELWADKQYTLVVAQPDALDLMLYHSKPQAYGAHIGVYVGDGIIYHLSLSNGTPKFERHVDLLKQEKYRYFIGAKRVRDQS